MNRYAVEGKYATEGPDGIQDTFAEGVDAISAAKAIEQAKDQIRKDHPNARVRFWEFEAAPYDSTEYDLEMYGEDD